MFHIHLSDGVGMIPRMIRRIVPEVMISFRKISKSSNWSSGKILYGWENSRFQHTPITKAQEKVFRKLFFGMLGRVCSYTHRAENNFSSQMMRKIINHLPILSRIQKSLWFFVTKLLDEFLWSWKIFEVWEDVSYS